MANQIELIEGFDQFSTTVAQVGRFYTMTGGSNSLVDASSIVVEGRALKCPNGGAITMGPLPADDEYYVGFHFWNDTANPMSGTLFSFRESTTEHVRVTLNADNTISVTRAGTALTGGVSGVVGPWLQNIAHFIEVYAKIHDTTGAFEVKLDGVSICSGSGVDTRNGGTGVIDNTQHAGSGSLGMILDNYYAASGSAGFQGEGRVVTDMPVADGTHADFTPSSGSDNYAMVDEQPADDDTTYNSSATATNRDSFDGATFGVTGTVKAVALAVQARKDDAGVRTLQLSLRSLGTDYDGTDKVLTTSYAGYQSIWVVDPGTGVAFVDSDIDSIEIGYENV